MSTHESSSHRLVVVSGPSCAGKSPLKSALDREFTALADAFESPVLYHSRAPRPGETDGEDYHFRGRDAIEALRDRDGFRVFEVRDDLQAVDLDALEELMASSDVFYEGNEQIGIALAGFARSRGVDVVDVFLSPLALAEVRALRDADGDLEADLTELMRRRLLRRTAGKHALLGLPALEDIEVRAKSAIDSLREAHRFSHVIPCHDGEDSDHWTVMARTIGDARRAVHALAGLLRGERPDAVERWPADLFGEAGE